MKRIRYIYGTLITMAICLGSCVDETEITPDYIEFGVTIQYKSDEPESTRGTTDPTGNYASKSPKSMLLYAMHTNATFINEEVTVSNGVITPALYKVWPNESTGYHFFAFANYGSWAPTPYHSTSSCEIPEYTIPANASGQEDLMFSSATPARKDQVTLLFHHMLSRLSFKAKSDGFLTNAEVVITKIEIENALNKFSGNLTHNAKDYEWDAPTTEDRNTTFFMNVRKKNLTTTLDTLTAGTIDDYNMFMFPHKNTDFENANDPTKAVKLKITYEIGGVEKSQSIDLHTLTEKTGGTEHFWGIGRWTVYEITVKPTGLLLNVIVQPWIDEESDWYFLNRKLSVSQTEVNITDYNGARVYFSSNMPEVKVMEEVYDLQKNKYEKTNIVFNDLAKTDFNSHKPYRFYYNYDTILKEGNGYIEVLLDDSINTVGTHEYLITLAASDNSKSERYLKRNIKVTINQYGTRATSSQSDTRKYVGAFFRRNETGERIIMDNNLNPKRDSTNVSYGSKNKWEATIVEGADFITITSSPSLDPRVGRSGHDGLPVPEDGDAEKYRVTANDLIGENGTKVYGRGRIYFRIGINGTTTENRYGLIEYKYRAGNDTYSITRKVYVRQGELADYVYSDGDDLGDISKASLAGHITTRTSTAKFSPYNLTVKAFKGKYNTDPQVKEKGNQMGVAVNFPSQAGAYFQWAYPDGAPYSKNYMFMAYAPNASILHTDFDFQLMKEYPEATWKDKYWDDEFKKQDLCPPGFHRPSDGPTDKPAINAPYYYVYKNSGVTPSLSSPKPGNYVGQIASSEVRMSLFLNPDAGQSASIGKHEVDGTNNNGNPTFFERPLISTFPYRGGEVYVYDSKTTYPEIPSPLGEFFPTESNYRSGNTTFPKSSEDGLEGFYADGFYDRHPKNVPGDGTNWTAKYGTNENAYPGVLFVNATNNKSLFMPNAGRRNVTTKDDEPTKTAIVNGIGTTGYYWTASAGPYYSWKYPLTAWSMETQYYWVRFATVQQYFAQSVRCVADNDNTDLIMPQE